MACHLSQEAGAKTQLLIQSAMMDTGISKALPWRISIKKIFLGFAWSGVKITPARRFSLFCWFLPLVAGTCSGPKPLLKELSQSMFSQRLWRGLRPSWLDSSAVLAAPLKRGEQLTRGERPDGDGGAPVGPLSLFVLCRRLEKQDPLRPPNNQPCGVTFARDND